MGERIHWRAYDGTYLESGGLDDIQLANLHKLHGEAFRDGRNISYSRFLKYAEGNTVLIGIDMGEIAAMSSYGYQLFPSESYMSVNTMAVDERYRRQGIGSFMLSGVVSEAIDLGCDNVRLLARKSVLPFYMEHGFERNNGLETNLGYVPMHLRLADATLPEETTLRTPAKSV